MNLAPSTRCRSRNEPLKPPRPTTVVETLSFRGGRKARLVLMDKRAAQTEREAHFGFEYGVVSEAIGRERSAIAYYRHEIRRTSYFKAHFNLAHMLARRGRLSEAIVHYRRAARLSPRGALRSDVLNNLGTAYSRKGLTAKAITAFQQSSRENPRNASPCVNVALQFLLRGDLKRGRRWLDRAHRLRTLDAETDSWVAYALIKYDLGVPKGVRMLERFLVRNPKDWRAVADLAVGYMKLGDHAKAKSLARSAKRRAPKDREVGEQVARVLRNCTMVD